MIKVNITEHEAFGCQHSYHFTWFCIQKCKDAGIPIIGTLAFNGVERGSLEWFDDPVSGDRIFQWHETTESA